MLSWRDLALLSIVLTCTYGIPKLNSQPSPREWRVAIALIWLSILRDLCTRGKLHT